AHGVGGQPPPPSALTGGLGAAVMVVCCHLAVARKRHSATWTRWWKSRTGERAASVQSFIWLFVGHTTLATAPSALTRCGVIRERTPRPCALDRGATSELPPTKATARP